MSESALRREYERLVACLASANARVRATRGEEGRASAYAASSDLALFVEANRTELVRARIVQGLGRASRAGMQQAIERRKA